MRKVTYCLSTYCMYYTKLIDIETEVSVIAFGCIDGLLGKSKPEA